MSEGYTKSYRAKWQNPVFRNLLEAAIWSWMCETAAWKDTKVNFNGEVVQLRRGQLITSRAFMAKGFCAGERTIRTLLDRLTGDAMIDQQPTSRGTIITIRNYEKYQGDEKPSDQPKASRRPAADHNKKELKNLRTKELSKTPPEGVSADAWDEFLAQRKRKRATNTEYALGLVESEINKLKEQGFSPQALVEQSIRRGWTDIYPIKDNQNANTGRNTTYGNRPSKSERARAAILESATELGYADPRP